MFIQQQVIGVFYECTLNLIIGKVLILFAVHRLLQRLLSQQETSENLKY